MWGFPWCGGESNQTIPSGGSPGRGYGKPNWQHVRGGEFNRRCCGHNPVPVRLPQATIDRSYAPTLIFRLRFTCRLKDPTLVSISLSLPSSLPPSLALSLSLFFSICIEGESFTEAAPGGVAPRAIPRKRVPSRVCSTDDPKHPAASAGAL